MTHSLIATLFVATFAVVTVVTVRTVRAGNRAWQADRRDREAGVTYTWRHPAGGHPYLERSGPARVEGQPVGNMEAWARAEGVRVQAAPILLMIDEQVAS